MKTAAEKVELHINGLGVAVRGVRGPALLGAPDWAIVAAVSGTDGAPRAGLSTGDFSVSVLSNRKAAVTAHPVPLDGLREPMPGVYVLRLDRSVVDRLHGPFACVVDVGHVGGRNGDDSTCDRIIVPLER